MRSAYKTAEIDFGRAGYLITQGSYSAAASAMGKGTRCGGGSSSSGQSPAYRAGYAYAQKYAADPIEGANSYPSGPTQF